MAAKRAVTALDAQALRAASSVSHSAVEPRSSLTAFVALASAMVRGRERTL